MYYLGLACSQISQSFVEKHFLAVLAIPTISFRPRISAPDRQHRIIDHLTSGGSISSWTSNSLIPQRP
jgi:hypothetical protein